MSLSNYPQNYLRFNSLQTKQLNVAIQIEGLSDILSLVPLYTRVRYGDPDVHYGDSGLVYGGLRRVEGNRTYLSVESSLSITQKLEPEQGRSSVSLMSLVFIDTDGYLTQLCAPGVILDELLGNRQVRVFAGYQQTSFPEDYYTCFRGVVSGVTLQPGKVTLTLSDPNIRRRQTVFYDQVTTLLSDVDAASLTIPVGSTQGFNHEVLGPNGSYDSAVKNFIKIDSEFMQYGPTGLTDTSVTVLGRGAIFGQGTEAAVHTGGAQIDIATELSGNAIDLALKVMLSGWQGPWLTGQAVTSLGTALDAAFLGMKNVIRLDSSTDAVEDLGVVPGDYIYVTGDTMGNDGTYILRSFGSADDRPNSLLFVDRDLIPNASPGSATLAFRSKYDTLPDNAGLRMTPQEVDVAGHEKVRQRYFSGLENQMRILFQGPQTGKDIIESEFYLPLGAYALTRYGRLSIGYTRTPIPEDKVVYLDQTNIVNPESIVVTRSLTNRRFYNQIVYNYDIDVSGNVGKVIYTEDLQSVNLTGLVSQLPITANGVRSDLGGSILANRRSKALLGRYRTAAFEISLRVNWAAGSVIESGDVVAITDNGTLHIGNLLTGSRDLETMIMEVTDRSLDIKTGTCTLKLTSGLPNTLSDRYGTVSPSSMLTGLSTRTGVVITDSYSAIFPGQEYLKWTAYLGLPVQIHNYDWTRSAIVTIVSQDPSNPSRFILDASTPLPFDPQPGDIMDIAPYPSDTIKNENLLYKLSHLFWSPSVSVVAGISTTVFTVPDADVDKFLIGDPILIHDRDYGVVSDELKVASISGSQITASKSIGFTPSSGMTVELIGFMDGQGPYRWL